MISCTFLGTKETTHAALSWEHTIKTFVRYTADPGCPTGIK